MRFREEIQALSRQVLTVAVRYAPPTADSLLPVPGVVLGPAAAKIKNWDRNDVLLVVCDPGTVAAGVFTQNRFCAAPVTVCRDHLVRQHKTGASLRALVVNAGNANAGTGDAGLADAHAECVAVARLLGCAPEEVLPYSTGVIMEPLPVEKILSALPAARTAARADGWFAAANAIMTTDTVPKGASRRVDVGGRAGHGDRHRQGRRHDPSRHGDDARLHGHRCAARGAAARRHRPRSRATLRSTASTVDGDTSTNDSFVLARPARPRSRRSRARAIRAWRRCAPRSRSARMRSRRRSCATARARPSSSRSASKAAQRSTNAAASRIAIAHSPLVKTAFFASDPESRPHPGGGRQRRRRRPRPLDRCRFYLDDVLVVEQRRARGPTYREEDGQRVMKQERSRCASTSGAARPRRRCGPATSRTTTSSSTPITASEAMSKELSDLPSRARRGVLERVEALLRPARLPDPDWSKLRPRRAGASAPGAATCRRSRIPIAIRLDDLQCSRRPEAARSTPTRASSWRACPPTTCC